MDTERGKVRLSYNVAPVSRLCRSLSRRRVPFSLPRIRLLFRGRWRGRVRGQM